MATLLHRTRINIPRKISTVILPVNLHHLASFLVLPVVDITVPPVVVPHPDIKPTTHTLTLIRHTCMRRHT